MQLLDISDADTNEDEAIDECWATNYKNANKEYDQFYRADVNVIHISSIYINNKNEIQQITRDPKELSVSNYLTKDEITEIIKCKMKGLHENEKLKNISIFKYNINIDPENVEYFLKSNHNFNYLTPVKKIKDILFEQTITFFNDLNELIILFYLI
jgi:hypothetical protein